ncbi:hypothetical protein NEUTE1DRAFT_107833 [Neurospora tetrasperma FGSC 2508]|uniref:Uncharacterized protein n=1 Tax=Neurospora tetrasperma (strain FGSC 2508 / ATCC MYA-4615 / P0657) TaxID=510951 RepID=F8MCT1_NEUT8|nr:uncharacterized protein NEUTE1DRAFT_107833 [Neurospora tetrasperma FGSC 2508]EGO61329.1 hypothetical protein NEUTE1DRAFT_107833 [Neurospora tetrasperma FGSC 2508]EGZ74655.1 hypothetical protein NEUTE2DRAFT_135934 [Neurospora tetrasperma FGSC 2509]
MTEEAADTVLETGVETPTALASDDNGQRSDSPVLRNRAKRAFFRVWIPDQTRPEILNTSKHGISSLWSEIQCDYNAITGIPARETSIRTNLKELRQCDSDSNSDEQGQGREPTLPLDLWSRQGSLAGHKSISSFQAVQVRCHGLCPLFPFSSSSQTESLTPS